MVKNILCSRADLLIENESLIDCLPSVVFIIISISLFKIASTIWGLPSKTLLIIFTLMSVSLRASAVPFVATIVKPRLANLEHKSGRYFLSLSLTLTKTFPLFGIVSPAPCIAFPKASPKQSPLPITSPVDFISGPRIGSTFLNLLNGKTGALTA